MRFIPSGTIEDRHCIQVPRGGARMVKQIICLCLQIMKVCVLLKCLATVVSFLVFMS